MEFENLIPGPAAERAEARNPDCSVKGLDSGFGADAPPRNDALSVLKSFA
jgi:hypothetical protein